MPAYYKLFSKMASKLVFIFGLYDEIPVLVSIYILSR